MLAIALLVIGILSRVIYHSPNFTPVLALALFGGVYLKRRTALLAPLALMMASDLIIGMHDIYLFTWGSVILISALGLAVKTHKNPGTIFGASILAAVSFFIITNFGVWLMKYPHTFEGLTQCYILAVPFFRNTLASTLGYTAVFFGIYELMAAYVSKTRFSQVLLTK